MIVLTIRERGMLMFGQRVIRVFGLALILMLLMALVAPGALAAKPKRTVESGEITETFEVPADECFPSGEVTTNESFRFQLLEFPDGRIQWTGIFRGTFVFHTDEGVTYTGRFVGSGTEVITHKTEVATFSFNVTGRGDDGSLLRVTEVFHVTIVDGEPVVEVERIMC
jgi:hypothetical protein